MSNIKLNSIVVNKGFNIDDPDFYVGAVIPSESGYLEPKLITSTTQLNSIYGDFKFKGMYEMLIENEVPICLLPWMSKESKFNRSSLRLSPNSEIPVCYPRYGKEYKLQSAAKAHYIKFSDANKVTLAFESDYLPLVSVSVIKSKDDTVYTEVMTEVHYKLNDQGHGGEIIVDFGTAKFGTGTYDDNGNEITEDRLVKYTGELLYEEIPDLDSGSNDNIEFYHDTLYSNGGDDEDFIIPMKTKYLPEIVFTEKVSDNEYRMVGSMASSDPTGNPGSPIKVKIGKCIKGQYRADIRYIRNDLVISSTDFTKELINNCTIHPIIKFNHSNNTIFNQISYGTLTYSKDDKETYLTYGFNKDDKVEWQYNFIPSDKINNYQPVIDGIESFNTVIDFTNATGVMSYDNPYYSNKSYSIQTLNTGRLILDTANHVIKIGTKLESTASEAYDTGQIIDYFSDWAEYDKDNNLHLVYDKVKDKKSIVWDQINYIKDNLQEFYVPGAYTLENLLEDYIHRFCELHGEGRSGGEIEVNRLTRYYQDDILEDFKNDSYIEEFYLTDREYVEYLIDQLIIKIKDSGAAFDQELLIGHIVNRKYTGGLLKEVVNYEISEDRFPKKLLVKYNLGSVDQHNSSIKGLTYESKWNYDQDILCKYTEDDKVIDVYSKIKGPVGANITITINKVKDIDDLYTLHITNGILVEDYTVYLVGAKPDLIDAIYIGDVGLTSKLVDIIVYDYMLNNTYIDSHHYDFEANNVTWNENNVRLKESMVLTPGTYQLRRNSEEYYTYDDLMDSYEIFKESDWYPDLFLVDEVPNNIGFFKDLLSLVDWNENPDKSIFSQALVCLKYHQLGSQWRGGSLNNKFINKNNRLLYFYDTMIINGIEVPSYYPYILNILGMDPIKIPDAKLIYDPLSWKTGVGKYIGVSNDIPYYFIKLLKITSIDQKYRDFLDIKEYPNKDKYYYYCTFEFTYVRKTVSGEKLVDPNSDQLISKCTFKAYLDKNHQFADDWKLVPIIDKNGDITGEQLSNTIFINPEYSIQTEYYDSDGNRKLFDGMAEMIDRYYSDYLDSKPIISDIKDFLVDYKVNFLYYDNLRYYYYTLRESENANQISENTIFLIRFITSKYTRFIYSIRRYLTGRDQYSIHRMLNNINSRCMNLIPYISSSSFSFDVNFETVSVKYDVKIVDLTNKEYKLNIILNV